MGAPRSFQRRTHSLRTLGKAVASNADQIDYLSHVGAATGERGDTALDRTVALYAMLRSDADPATWHTNKALREFITQTQDDNPYIPARVRERELASRKVSSSPRTFRPVWQSAGYRMRPLEISVEQFEATMLKAPDIINAFKASNLHNLSYFFTKLAEWYITLDVAASTYSQYIVDLGAAYDGFAEVATKNMLGIRVAMVDLMFPAGERRYKDRISRIGSDAGNLAMIDDNSVDIVCAHNAFEHFSGDSDTRCVKEIARILKPGGRALISPLFSDEIYSLSINPFSCFVATSDQRLANDIHGELDTPRVRVDYRPNIISPYSRRYDLAALQARVLSHAPDLEPCLIVPEFAPDGFGDDGRYHRPILGFELRSNIFDERVFHCLELIKRG